MLVDVDCNNVEFDRGALLKSSKSVKKNEAVLSSAHGNHDTIAVFNHAEIRNGLCGEANNAFSQLFDGNRLLVSIAKSHVDAVFAVLEKFIFP